MCTALICHTDKVVSRSFESTAPYGHNNFFCNLDQITTSILLSMKLSAQGRTHTSPQISAEVDLILEMIDFITAVYVLLMCKLLHFLNVKTTSSFNLLH